ncbi:MAG: class 1 fructose-bisphosphatase [Deltaproteobacteria bacterium]|jgi:fructose-1,6-bisphosphatase I
MDEKQEKRMTLDRFLVQRQWSHPGASGELTRVMIQVGVVAKIISSYVRRAALENLLGYTGEVNVQGEEVKKLDELGNAAFVEAFEYVDIVGALVSEERDRPLSISSDKQHEKYVVLVDPIDGSSNLDVDCVIGSIFSIRSLKGTVEESILQKGTEQIAAGYIMYGPSVLLVYSAADGVHSFVLDEQIGEFVLDHESIRMPEKGKIVSANFGNYSRWNAPARAFSDSITAEEGTRYSLRYSGALVADLHQILHYGGVYFYPEDDSRPQGKLRLLYECAPMAMIAEQAGGSSSTGAMRVIDVRPGNIHQRIPFAIGSRYEVQKYDEIHRTFEKSYSVQGGC